MVSDRWWSLTQVSGNPPFSKKKKWWFTLPIKKWWFSISTQGVTGPILPPSDRWEWTSCSVAMCTPTNVQSRSRGHDTSSLAMVETTTLGRGWDDVGELVSVYIYIYGSRSKTHARLLVSEWHLHIWMYVFAAVAKDRERAAKGSRKVWTPLFINIYVIVIVFMLGRFLAELPQDPCLGLYAASIQHFDRYLCRVM